MTDKRFKMGESDVQGEMMFLDTQTNKIYWQEYFDEVVELVNELAEENEQLRKELDYFKPVMFQDMRKGTVILYSKGDINE